MLALVASAACSRAPERSVESFCTAVAPIQGLDRILAGGDASETRRQVDQLRAAQDVAPAEVEPAVARLVTITDELASTLGTTPDAEVAADQVFRRHQDEIADITAAGTAVERYAAEHCGIALNPTGTTVTTGTTAAPPGPTVLTTTR